MDDPQESAEETTSDDELSDLEASDVEGTEVQGGVSSPASKLGLAG